MRQNIANETLRVTGRFTLHAVAKERAYVYTRSSGREEWELHSSFEGEFMHVYKMHGELMVESKGDVWARNCTVNYTRFPSSSEVFTSLDRPPPLSPEMMAIQRLMRQNSIDRERNRASIENMRATYERERLEKVREAEQVVEDDDSEPDEAPEPAAKKVRRKGKPSKPNAADAVGEDDGVPQGDDPETAERQSS